MARGALKGLKRTRPSAGEKVVVKGQLAQGGAGRSPGQNTVGSQGAASSPNAGAELDNAELVSWLNCECFFSLVLVGLLAALPFNLHTQELMQTPETYVARALELSEDGAFDKAASLYERAVNIEETAERHVLLGEALVLAERKGEALWHYGRAADLFDDREYKVSTLVSLGQVQTEEGYSDDAVETYLQVLSLQQDEDPDEVADAHVQASGVAMSLLDSHNHSEAVGHLELATALVPDLTQAQELLANTLRDMGSVEEAIRRYKSIIAQRSTDIETLVQLGYAYHELCDFSQALAIYKKARSSPTKAAEMDYLTAALHSKSLRPSRAPAAYVADLFDLEVRKNGFLASQAKRTALASAEDSDSSESPGPLAEARRSNGDRGMFYDVHGLIFDRVAPNMRSMIEAALGLPPDGLGRRGLQWLDILDLGCGRGTMGSQLKHLANFITGVDLSERAIKHALREGSYDSIQHGDAIAVVNTMLPNSFDLVVAADMVPYFGDLGDLFRAIAAVTRPGGLVAFNADALDAIDDGSGGANAGGNVRAFDLKFTGRWSHRRKYVTQSVAAAGLSVLGVRVIKGRTRLVSTAAGEIVLEAAPQERRTTIFLCGKGTMT
ncbi:unnamed protein product [Ectocarpus sp. 6 AP-2014]